MLKKFATPLLLLMLTFNSCNDGVDLSKFRLTYITEMTFTEANTQIVDSEIYTDSMTYDLAEDMAFHQSSIDLLDDCFIVECALEVESPDNGNFTFLNDIELYLVAEGVEQKLFAKISNVPEAVKRFLIPVHSDVSVVEHLRTEKLKFRAKFNSRRTLTSDLKVKLTTDFMVHTR